MTDLPPLDELRKLLAKATPGPWVADSGEGIKVRNPDTGAVCQIGFFRDKFGARGTIPNDEAHANAHLIAAAPDLAADLLDARKRIAWLEQRISEIVEAYDSGHLRMESPEIDLGEDGCAPFHEMWLSYVRKK